MSRPTLNSLTTLLISGFLLSNISLAQDIIPFTAEQAVAGKARYQEHCQICHGTRLSNGQFGTPLKGSYFKKNWAGKSLGELVQFVYESMPPDNTMSFTTEEYAEVIAFIMESNRLEANGTAISGDIQALNQIQLPW